MLRQLPATITADQTPEWLPAGWVVHSTALKRGRQKRSYTNLRTGKKFSTKDQVLEYIKMVKLREERESGIERRKASLKAFQETETTVERPFWLPDDWQMELRIGAFGGNQYKMYVNTSTGFKTQLKEKELSYQNTMEFEASLSEEDETGCNQISYIIDESEEDLSETEYFEYKCSQEKVEPRSMPERMQKLESRAKTQCVFEDEDMSSDSDKNLPEAEASKEEGCSNEAKALEEARVVPHLVESFEEENLHDVVVECDDKAREIPGLEGSFSIEINLECEPESDSLIEKDLNKSGIKGTGTRNVEIRDQDSDSMHISASSKVVEVTQEPGDNKSEEPLKAQEETANELGTAKSSPEDLRKTVGIGLNPQEEIISGSKKRKKSSKPCSSKNIKKKDVEAPHKKLRKGKKPIDWPEPCPNFPFEPLARSFQVEDDSVIRRYLEQHFAAAGSADSNLPLPDFGLPSFSDIKISRDEEPESKKKKSHDPSSLPSCSAMGTMQQIVAGN